MPLNNKITNQGAHTHISYNLIVCGVGGRGAHTFIQFSVFPRIEVIFQILLLELIIWLALITL